MVRDQYMDWDLWEDGRLRREKEKKERKELIASFVGSAKFKDQSRRNRVCLELILEEQSGCNFVSCVMQSIVKYAIDGKVQDDTPWPVTKYHMKEIDTRYT